ncbi:MAG: alkaline phosphatase [bacterium]
MRGKTAKIFLGLSAGAFLFVLSVNTALCASLAERPKNIILMISDGQGFNTIQATNYYTGSTAVYEDFDVKYAMKTNSANNPAGYSSAGMAADFDYAKSGATDSASAATAMYTGQKIYDGVINMTTTGQPITTYFENAAMVGKSVGAVSSVEFSHATPAAVYAHNTSRNNYAEISNEGIYGSNANSHNAYYDAQNYNGNLKVLMGAGHGDYDDNGAYDPSRTDNYVGGTATWNDIKDGAPNGWTYVDTKAGFEAVANGTSNPDKLLGVAQINTTLQQSRNGYNTGDAPYDDPLNAHVPTLETMTKAALNVLDNNPNGFAVMIEGGAVDWANHANQLGRMIEEQIDFDSSVQAVVDWVTMNSSWDETLLIVTADHECGHLWGTGGLEFIDNNDNGIYDSGIDTFLAYKQIVDNGAGNLPGGEFFSTGHTNALVPLFAKGAGSDLFEKYVVGTDGNLAAIYGLDSSWTGQYVDNTAVFGVMNEAAPVPVPSTALLFFTSLLVLPPLKKKWGKKDNE